MKFKLLIVVFFLTIKVGAINVGDPLENVREVAMATNKLIVVDFYADWCGPCKKMDSESWHSDQIAEVLANYIFVKIDIDKYSDIAKKYGIRGIPYTFILDSNGNTIHKYMGYLKRSDLYNMLEKYAINMKYLQTAYLINFKKETISSNIRLAQKQQEFSLFMDKDIQMKFLLLSEGYLSRAKKISKKEGNTRYIQKIDLLGIQTLLIRKKYEKVDKKLKKDFDENKIEESNKSLYYFLNYVVSEKNQKKEAAEKWLTKLKGEKTSKVFLKEISVLVPRDS